MKKKGIARMGDILSNLAAGRLTGAEYVRQPVPAWDVGPHEYVLLSNVNIIDVNLGHIREERGLLIKEEWVDALIKPADVPTVRTQYPIKREIDGQDLYLIPGLSDIHGHLTLISEFDLSLKSLRFFDAQRQRNCEEALKAGCTFVRDSGGACVPLKWLQEEIENHRLLGPKILPSYEVMTPKGGMWDVSPMMNYLARMIFGGKLIHFLSTTRDIRHTMAHLHEIGCGSFKTYFEEKPLYGKTEETIYPLFPQEQANLFRELADRYGKPLEAHAMFIKGARRVIDARFDSIAHMTVDAPYTLEDARNMVRNDTAVVPTLSLGCYLAMNCGTLGHPDHPDFRFFQEMLGQHVPAQIERTTVPELRGNYMHFKEWIEREMPDRRMPAIGRVYPDRVHGFARNAQESFRNFQEAGTKVGMGTDGGTGITFAGQLEIEFKTYERFGYSPAQILRMATLGNMEILKKDHALGSIDIGKQADLVLLERNPLEDIHAVQCVRMVMKDGRMVVNHMEGADTAGPFD